jgi:hypothetical protein
MKLLDGLKKLGSGLYKGAAAIISGASGLAAGAMAGVCTGAWGYLKATGHVISTAFKAGLGAGLVQTTLMLIASPLWVVGAIGVPCLVGLKTALGAGYDGMKGAIENGFVGGFKDIGSSIIQSKEDLYSAPYSYFESYFSSAPGISEIEIYSRKASKSLGNNSSNKSTNKTSSNDIELMSNNSKQKNVKHEESKNHIIYQPENSVSSNNDIEMLSVNNKKKPSNIASVSENDHPNSSNNNNSKVGPIVISNDIANNNNQFTDNNQISWHLDEKEPQKNKNNDSTPNQSTNNNNNGPIPFEPSRIIDDVNLKASILNNNNTVTNNNRPLFDRDSMMHNTINIKRNMEFYEQKWPLNNNNNNNNNNNKNDLVHVTPHTYIIRNDDDNYDQSSRIANNNQVDDLDNDFLTPTYHNKQENNNVPIDIPQNNNNNQDRITPIPQQPVIHTPSNTAMPRTTTDNNNINKTQGLSSVENPNPVRERSPNFQSKTLQIILEQLLKNDWKQPAGLQVKLPIIAPIVMTNAQHPKRAIEIHSDKMVTQDNQVETFVAMLRTYQASHTHGRMPKVNTHNDAEENWNEAFKQVYGPNKDYSAQIKNPAKEAQKLAELKQTAAENVKKTSVGPENKKDNTEHSVRASNNMK